MLTLLFKRLYETFNASSLYVITDFYSIEIVVLSITAIFDEI